MIRIERPQVRTNGTAATLFAFVTIDSVHKKIRFKINKKYEEHLCYERGDTFVIATLNFAMRNHHDIVSETPLSKNLYYNIDEYLPDAIARYDEDFYRPQIAADVSPESLPCVGAVGTGIPCGVDSMHILASRTAMKFRKHSITHLAFNDVGGHGEEERTENLYHIKLERPKRFAERYGFEFVTYNSNLQNAVEQDHFKSHTYSSTFTAYYSQKLYPVYCYASSGYRYNEFRLDNKVTICCGSCDMLSLLLLSTHSLGLYSEGESMSRTIELRSVIRYAPSYGCLSIRLKEEHNCGKCERCVRTLLGIDTLGALNKYSTVFDINYYREHKKWYLIQVLERTSDDKHDCFEMYPYSKDEVAPCMRIQVMSYKIADFFRRLIPGNSRFFNISKSIREM